MRFSSLYNIPNERRRITYSHVWWDNGFSEEELIKLEDICSQEELELGVTIGANEGNALTDIRDSKVKFIHKNCKTDWVFDRFNFIAESLNNQFYGFDLNGYEKFQYTVYEPDGKYDWHMDTIFGNTLDNDMFIGDTRKLTITMLLNEPGKDFTGGEFQINDGNQNTPVEPEYFKGRILAFPSFFSHRVAPVLSGVRKSIVIWIEGPKFR